VNRYIPIFISDFENINASLQFRNVNISLTPQSLSEMMYNTTVYPQQPIINYVYVILYVLMVVFSILIIYIVMLYLKSRVSGSTPYISIFRDIGSDLGLFAYEYSYEGLAKMLREIFMGIRDKLCGRHCTPRETASKCSSINILKLFADVYEDVVYGMKLRIDAVNIVNEVKRYFSEDQ